MFLFLFSLWFFGWCGSVFLLLMWMIFVVVFDWILFEWVVKVDDCIYVLIVVFLLMFVLLILISYLYVYNLSFYGYMFDVMVVIVIIYFGTMFLVIVFLWWWCEIYQVFLIVKYELVGILLVSIVGVIFGGFLVYCGYKWFFIDVYGINYFDLLKYMVLFYVIAIVIYVISWVVRCCEGIDFVMINFEILVE